jgi:putative protease
MKILTTLHDIEYLDQILSVADGILIGHTNFAKTLTNDFGTETNQIIFHAYNQQKEIFILLNRIFTDSELTQVEQYIKDLPNDLITGFIGADLGLISVLEKLNLSHKFVYNPETLLTNDVDFNDLASLNIKGVFVSKEITLNDILDIGALKQYQLFYFGHGHMSMFYSKRQMLNTFMDYQNASNTLHEDKSLRLNEAKRPDESYPIIEDDAGTHVFRGHIFNSFKAIDKLESVVDYFIVDTLFLDDAYALDIIKMYKAKVIDASIMRQYNQTLHDGFLFDESTIKGEKND